MSESFVYPFRERGHYVEVHNVVFDYIMPNVKPTSFKVVCFIIRQTKGWGDKDKGLSFRDIKNGTGIKSDTTVSDAIKELLSGGYIHKISGEICFESNKYGLNLNFKIAKNRTPKNGVLTTLKNGVHEDSSTPKNGVVATPENGVRSTPKNGDIYKSSTNQQIKYDDVREENQNSNFQSDPIQKFPEITDAVFDALGSLQKSRYEMGTVSSKRRIEIQKIVGMLAHENRTIEEIIKFRDNWPKFLNKDSPDPPTPRQMLDEFDRVVNWKPRGKVSMTQDEQLARMREMRKQQEAQNAGRARI